MGLKIFMVQISSEHDGKFLKVLPKIVRPLSGSFNFRKRQTYEEATSQVTSILS